jgi:two-component system copper resistance phosphate regulon response regulator CusR
MAQLSNVTSLKQRVLVVEDDLRMLELISKGLRDVGHTPIPAPDGDAGLELAMGFDFDSIILDIGLPGRDGYSIAHALRANKQVPILMLTARDSEEDILRGFDFGADDYLTKPFSFREMLARLDILGRISPRYRDAQLLLDSARLMVHREGASIQLTRSEFLLLKALHQKAGGIIERQALMEAVWGTHAGPANSLDVLVNSLRGKLDAHHSLKMIVTVRGIGYRLNMGSSEAQFAGARS